VLSELGYSDATIADLVQTGAVVASGAEESRRE
jgi:hypothetical protein